MQLMRTIFLCTLLMAFGSSEVIGEPLAKRSILVLPPINNSLDTEATRYVLSALMNPLAERGYYVFPLYTVRMLFEREELSEPSEIHSIAPSLLYEMFGADLVLYTIINQWDSGSEHEISISVYLRDKVGDLVWSKQHAGSFSSGSNNIPFVQGSLDNATDTAFFGYQFTGMVHGMLVIREIFGNTSMWGTYKVEPTDSKFPVGPYFISR